MVLTLEGELDPAISQTRHHSFRGTPVGIAQISDMQVEYDPEAEVGQRVLVGGQWLDLEGICRVAHIGAETMPDLGYLVLDEGQTTEQEVPTILREVLEDYLGQHSPLSEPVRGRWLVAAKGSQDIV